jgi:hypothetical protein
MVFLRAGQRAADLVGEVDCGLCSPFEIGE